MAVKLDFAYANNKLHHISEDLYKHVDYTCPFCKEVLIFRKGEIKEHHFSHKPNSNCTATVETALHFNAKHYLQSECENPSGYDIFFDFPIRKHVPAINDLADIIDIKDEYTVSLNDILVFYRAICGCLVEHRVGPYIADTYVQTKGNDKGFVVEVCVTHEMEEDKRAFLTKNKIPYLELTPTPKDNSKIEFSLKSYFYLSFLIAIEIKLIKN